jgi:hypothetical protein
VSTTLSKFPKPFHNPSTTKQQCQALSCSKYRQSAKTNQFSSELLHISSSSISCSTNVSLPKPKPKVNSSMPEKFRGTKPIYTGHFNELVNENASNANFLTRRLFAGLLALEQDRDLGHNLFSNLQSTQLAGKLKRSPKNHLVTSTQTSMRSIQT